MSLETREARQPWILLAPALTTITLLLLIPLLFIVVYSFDAHRDRCGSGRVLPGQLAGSAV
ncbi:MAG: hypothetical protein R3E95_18700 [Thiolinea sp.]